MNLDRGNAISRIIIAGYGYKGYAYEREPADGPLVIIALVNYIYTCHAPATPKSRLGGASAPRISQSVTSVEKSR